MSTQNYTILGNSEPVRARRFKVLQLLMRNATQPEIAHVTGQDLKQVYRDVNFLKTIKLNDLPLEIIIDNGANFFELKVRELQAKAATIPWEPKNYKDVINLEKLIIDTKEKSLKIQGAYSETGPVQPGPITIIFEEVEAGRGKYSAELNAVTGSAEADTGEDDEP